MLFSLRRYTKWLHTRWPAGHVEKLPLVDEHGATNVPGLYVVGDLTGIPLLKFSSDTGARAVQAIVADRDFAKRRKSGDGEVIDLAIIGAGVSGMAAALEARKHELNVRLYEAAEPFSTIVNFPKGKPIYTYPKEMIPAGELGFSDRSSTKEGLLDELRDRTIARGITPIIARVERVVRKGHVLEVQLRGGECVQAHRVIVGIGRSGNFRKLGVSGEDRNKVYNRLHDPEDFCEKDVLVVGGGDSALETAIALASCGSRVTISYRKPEFSRPKPDNIEKLRALETDPTADVAVEEPVSERITTAAGAFMGPRRKAGSVRLMLASRPKEIADSSVVVTNSAGHDEEFPNDAVFAMIGREPPLGFFRRCGVRIRGERRASSWAGFGLFVVFCAWLYHWKKQAAIPGLGAIPSWLNPQPDRLIGWISGWSASLAAAANDPASLLGTLKISMADRSFTYSLAYTLIVIVFGVRRIRRRRTPYVTVQTLTLMAIQAIPLFVLPEIVLPLLGHNGIFDDGILKWFADQFFPVVHYGHGREYWRAYGFVLAWPLMAWNFFTQQPLWGWLILGSIQTFVILPAMIYFFGKGVYCGWICSCGALAETLGDTHRHKMPHGPKWNRLNMIGQLVLLWAVLLMMLRIAGWVLPDSWCADAFVALAEKLPVLNYKWFVDLMLAGVVGYGCYFWFSGRVWCRFACPLAALMHIYARFSRFRILSEKKKCISCNICTSVCHQGIDVMNFANKGLPMADPECVRCSACVQGCPTGVLSFGQVDRETGETISIDRLAASPVRMIELTVAKR